jgi:very-short-patch-repair endonuclease
MDAECLVTFNGQTVANTVWGFATLGIRNGPLMDALARRAMDAECLETFNDQEVTNTAWGFATLGITNKPLLDALITKTDFLASFSAQNLTTTAWAMAASDASSDTLLCTLLPKLEHQVANMGPRELSQIHQVMYDIELCPGDFPSALAAIPATLRVESQGAFALAARDTYTSKLQKEVARVLRSIGVVFEEEVILADAGYYTADIACLHDRLLFEVDGPFHFAEDALGQAWVPNGATMMKRRHLRASGYRLVSLPFFEWDREPEKAVYLHGKLCAMGINGLKSDPVAKANGSGSESASDWQTTTRKTKQCKKT